MPVPTVFISYSHKDEVWKNRLLAHLLISVKGGILEVWDDRRIAAGDEWHAEIERIIESAQMCVLLISANFLTSDFIRREEIPRMLIRRRKDGMRLVPVLVRSCDWEIVDWLKQIQMRPTDARPLASLKGDQRDEQMTKIAREVRELLGIKPAVPELGLPISPPDSMHPPALLEEVFSPLMSPDKAKSDAVMNEGQGGDSR
ncbi:MAG TPA: toll/interleukin-1 receptor domain-containing protein [Thermoanaerobaculia bacterium]|jgi:hypothetical protein|nr:toll/interleukin-1 receptor domain-containing protein [Thermoanaerobaculia bacterium]